MEDTTATFAGSSISSFTPETAPLLQRAEKAEAELAMFRQLYDHALDCVDQVFQVCSEIPNPILPNFLMAGSNKFDGVIKLAKSFAAAQQREAKLRELCSKQKAVWTYQVLKILDGKGGE